MLDHPALVIPVTVAIIVASAFFVAVEFALLAAKRHRLEEAAPTSRSARAALRSSSELTLLLAGSQLGITACTLALGAITKPAVHHWLMVPLGSLGLPQVAGDIIAFVLALLVVTFLHLVIGEMAPKSWAIAHPETSATLLALPMRAFMFPTRPLLVALNSAANWMLRRVGVTPTNEVVTGQTSADLEQLVRHSANVGALDAAFTAQVSGALELERLTVVDLVPAVSDPISVPTAASVADVREISTRTGHLRILVASQEQLIGLIHVRDVLVADPAEDIDRFVRPLLVLDPGLPAYQAVAQLRQTRNQLAVVGTAAAPIGVITISDILQRVLVTT